MRWYIDDTFDPSPWASVWHHLGYVFGISHNELLMSEHRSTRTAVCTLLDAPADRQSELVTAVVVSPRCHNTHEDQERFVLNDELEV